MGEVGGIWAYGRGRWHMVARCGVFPGGCLLQGDMHPQCWSRMWLDCLASLQALCHELQCMRCIQLKKTSSCLSHLGPMVIGEGLGESSQEAFPSPSSLGVHNEWLVGHMGVRDTDERLGMQTNALAYPS